MIRKKIDTFKILEFSKWFEEFYDSSDFSFAVVYPLEHRHPDLDMIPLHQQLFKVFEYHLVANSCQLKVSVRIDVLQIEEEKINIFRKAKDRFLFRISARLNSRMQTFLLARLQQIDSRFRLRCHFAASQCHTAA